jgi:hypothetical protein
MFKSFFNALVYIFLIKKVCFDQERMVQDKEYQVNDINESGNHQIGSESTNLKTNSYKLEDNPFKIENFENDTFILNKSISLPLSPKFKDSEISNQNYKINEKFPYFNPENNYIVESSQLSENFSLDFNNVNYIQQNPKSNFLSKRSVLFTIKDPYDLEEVHLILLNSHQMFFVSTT